jgi:hypothetical protein
MVPREAERVGLADAFDTGWMGEAMGSLGIQRGQGLPFGVLRCGGYGCGGQEGSAFGRLTPESAQVYDDDVI